MGFLRTILSLAPTIGQILGSFAPAKGQNGEYEGYVGFFAPSNDDRGTDVDKLCFIKKSDGSILARNTAKHDSDYITINFNKKGNIAGETVHLSGFSEIDVTNLFYNHSQAKNDTFTVTTMKTDSDQITAEETSVITLQANAESITVQNGSYPSNERLGSFLNVNICNNSATTSANISVVESKLYSIKSISYLSLKKHDDQMIQTITGKLDYTASPQKQVKIDLEPLPEKLKANFSIVAELLYHKPQQSELLNSEYKIRTLSPEDIEALKKMKKLNDVF